MSTAGGRLTSTETFSLAVLFAFGVLLILPCGSGGGAILPAVIIFKNPSWPSTSSVLPKTARVVPPPQEEALKYTPAPPDCPETGRTVCANVHSYPEDAVFDMVKQTRYRVFNFSSVFVDERDGFDEPQLWQHWATPDQTPLSPSSPPPPPLTAISQQHSAPPAYSVTTLLVLQDAPQYSYEKMADAHRDHPNPWWDLKSYSKTLSRRKRNSGSGAEPACETRHLYISPKAALSDKNQWKYIVNVQERDPRIKQIVRAEICRSSDEACSSSIGVPFGYTSVCRQKYLKKKLLSLDIDGRGLSEENFFVPSCCVCELIRSSS